MWLLKRINVKTRKKSLKYRRKKRIQPDNSQKSKPEPGPPYCASSGTLSMVTGEPWKVCSPPRSDLCSDQGDWLWYKEILSLTGKYKQKQGIPPGTHLTGKIIVIYIRKRRRYKANTIHKTIGYTYVKYKRIGAKVREKNRTKYRKQMRALNRPKMTICHKLKSTSDSILCIKIKRKIR